MGLQQQSPTVFCKAGVACAAMSDPQLVQDIGTRVETGHEEMPLKEWQNIQVCSPPATRSELFTPFRKGRFPLNTKLSEFSIQVKSPFSRTSK